MIKLKYSTVTEYFNEEKKQLLTFIAQTIDEFDQKYSPHQLINDEPVLVYLYRISQMFRYQIIRRLLNDLPKADVRHRWDGDALELTLKQWHEEVDWLLNRRMQIRQEIVDDHEVRYCQVTRAIKENNRQSKEQFDRKREQIEERTTKTKDTMMCLFHDVTSLGKLLCVVLDGSETLPVTNAERLIGEVVRLTEQLVELQGRLPRSCQLNGEAEGKDLLDIVYIESVRIEVIKIIYWNTFPYYHESSSDSWDNRILLVKHGEKTVQDRGSIKPSKAWGYSWIVDDLFDGTVKFSADRATRATERCEIRLMAGLARNNKWKQMTSI